MLENLDLILLTLDELVDGGDHAPRPPCDPPRFKSPFQTPVLK